MNVSWDCTDDSGLEPVGVSLPAALDYGAVRVAPARDRSDALQVVELTLDALAEPGLLRLGKSSPWQVW